MKPENHSEHLSVLVIDDEQSIRDGSERILIRMGFQVFKACQGIDGLKILEENPISIVLLDLKMPGMDGIEVLSRINDLNPEILVIVITGYATIETAIEAMKKGAYDFIPKPFEPDQLRIVVNRAREKLRLTAEAGRLEEERLRSLTDLGTEKSRIRTIVESLPNGVLVTNTQGQVVLMNPAFCWLMGIDPEVQAGRDVECLIPDSGFCNLVRTLSRDSSDRPREMSHEFLLGEDKYLQAIARPVPGEDGQCLGTVVTVSDITALKVLDRLKSEFVAKVSHELRSPLSTIHEQLALVLRDMVEKESSRDQYLLSRAKEKTRGMISLIGDLLDLSHIEAGNVCKERKPVYLNDLLQSIVDFLGSKASSRGQTLTLHLPAEPLPPVSADPMALESIFGNLITNAIHYTPDGGSIRVTAQLVGDRIQVDVTDTGFGIEKRHLDQIFKRFFRVKNEKTRFITGTGLGLPIVKGLLDELGGTIQVTSVVDQGSTFRVQLPGICP